jgi:hypothetical protein
MLYKIDYPWHTDPSRSKGKTWKDFYVDFKVKQPSLTHMYVIKFASFAINYLPTGL